MQRIDSQLQKNLKISKEARLHSRKVIPEKNSNTNFSITDKQKLSFIASEIVNARRRIIPLAEYAYNLLIYPNDLFWKEIKIENRTSKLFHFGNCGELTRLALNYLKKHGVEKAEFVSIKNSDHVFIMIGREGSLDNPDPATWGPDCVILDVLTNEEYPATEIYSRLKCYRYVSKLDNPHIIRDFTQNDRLEVETTITEQHDKKANELQFENYQKKLAMIASHCQSLLSDEEFQRVHNELDQFSTIDGLEDLSNFKLDRILSKNIKRIIHLIINHTQPEVSEKIIINTLIDNRSNYKSTNEFLIDLTRSEELFFKIMKEIEVHHRPLFRRLQSVFHNKNLLEYLINDCIIDNKTKLMHYLLQFTHQDMPYHKDDKTPLHLATQFGFADLVKSFLEQGAAQDMEDINGDIPLFTAIKAENETIVKLLLEHSNEYTLGIKDNHGLSALHIASQSKNEEITKLLLTAGAPLHEKDDKGHTPLHLAVLTGSVELVEILLDAGADPNVKDKNNDSAHVLASKQKNSELDALFSQKHKLK